MAGKISGTSGSLGKRVPAVAEVVTLGCRMAAFSVSV